MPASTPVTLQLLNSPYIAFSCPYKSGFSLFFLLHTGLRAYIASKLYLLIRLIKQIQLLQRQESEGDMKSRVRMRFMAIALVMMVGISRCMASDRSSKKQEIDTENKQVNDQNDHHSIPLKDYRKPGPAQFHVTNDNDHHYITRKDYPPKLGPGERTVNGPSDIPPNNHAKHPRHE
ncbi:hypothetical protein VNO77_28872 [Canavalia gladiata]|uniref:Uncharacterized protein n=1 Tax=Canavalia gladiata TaxID=3824 RepID=A0AAN9L0S3_CANGL